MKFTLMLFLSAFVVNSQQFYLRSPNTPVFLFSPYSPYSHYYSPYGISSQLFPNNYRPLVVMNEGLNPNLSISPESQNITHDYSDTQSRIRDFSGKVQSSLDDDKQQQSGRFLAGSFGNKAGITYNGNLNNFFSKAFTSTSVAISLYTSTVFSTSISSITSTSTATIINTATLSLTSVVKCVPQFQVNVGAPSCGRKKRTTDDDSDDQFEEIVPSETQKLMPTAVPLVNSSFFRETQGFRESTAEETNDQRHLVLRSSQNEIEQHKQTSAEEYQKNLRDKRFFFMNKNFFLSTTTTTSILVVPTISVISSLSTLTAFTTTTVSSFIFSNSTVTQTVNLITPIPAVQCNALAAVAADQNCLSCLPAGYVVCGAAG